MVLVYTDASTIQPLPTSFANIANGDFLGLPNLLWIFVGGRGASRRSCCAERCSAATSTPSARTLSPRGCRAFRSRGCSSRCTRSPGLLAAVGGVLFTSRLNAGIPTAGTGYELNAIAACVIGGASLFGAKGGAFGAAAGALIVGDPQQRRQPARRERVLPADHHRRADPRRGGVRPVAGPPHMSVDPRAGTLPDEADLIDVDALLAAYTTSARPAEAPRVRSAPPATAARRSTARSTRRTCSRSARRSCRYRDGAGDRRAAVPRPRHARAVGAGVRARSSRCSAAHGVDVVRRRRRRRHADAGDLARDPHPQPRRRRAARPTASSSRRRTTRPATAASSTTRRTAGRPTPTSPAGSRTRPTSCSRPGSTASRACRSRRRRCSRRDYVDRLRRRPRRR